MSNENETKNTLDIVDEVIEKFASGYSELVKLGGNNPSLDDALIAYVDKIYKKKIAEICGVSPNEISDDLAHTIEAGYNCDKMIENGTFVMYRRNYSDDEIRLLYKMQNNKNMASEYVKGIEKENENVISTDGVVFEKSPVEVEEPVKEADTPATTVDLDLEKPAASEKVVYDEPASLFDSSQIESFDQPVPSFESFLENSEKKEDLGSVDTNISLESIDDLPVSDEISIAKFGTPLENVPVDVQDKYDVKIQQPDQIAIPEQDLVIGAPSGEKDLMALLNDKVTELVQKYSNSEAKDFLIPAILSLYKNALSQLTGIPADDIKNSVCERIMAGTTSQVTDENGNVVEKERPMTDDEAKLITITINNMSEDEVDELLNVSKSDDEETKGLKG